MEKPEYIEIDKRSAVALTEIGYVVGYRGEEFTLGEGSDAERRFWKRYGKAYLTRNGDLLVKDREYGDGFPYIEEIEETRGIQERVEEGIPFSDQEWEEIKEKTNPLDSSDRPTAIRITVATREKLKRWGKSKGIEKAGFDRIVLDLLESKGINNLDPKMVNLSPREKEIVRLIQKGINTTEEMKGEFTDEISLRSIQKEVNNLLRKDVIFQKRRGNLSEYFVKPPENP